jgi:hypothetical protein
VYAEALGFVSRESHCTNEYPLVRTKCEAALCSDPRFCGESLFLIWPEDQDTEDDEDDGEDEDEDGLGLAPGLAGFGEGDNLTYEQMLRLQERIGHGKIPHTENRGAPAPFPVALLWY